MASSSNILGDHIKEISEDPLPTDEQLVADAWSKFNLLTLDGGGIRGYWSLLALEQLMGYIGKEEEEQSTETEDFGHSFYPQLFPKHVSHTIDEDELRLLENHESHEYYKALPARKCYLPCHYFDYVGGTSTGGLIAIMLGRLRMNVPDCMKEYETFGDRIFGRPRFFNITKLPGMVGRSKYDANRLKAAFKDVARRRSEESSVLETARFATKPHTCRVFVTATKAPPSVKGSKKPASASMQLIRSYACDVADGELHRRAKASTARSKSSHSRLAGEAQNRKHVFPLMRPGPADNFKIWEVARAATAAPFYFDPIEIKDGDKVVHIFKDGGMGETTNPTDVGIEDIAIQETDDAVGIVVSVGTARGGYGIETDFFLRKTKDRYRLPIWENSNPDSVHDKVVLKQHRYRSMAYWRFDPSKEEHLLNMALDEWKPKRSPRLKKSPGWKTLSEIRSTFGKWAIQPEVQDQLRDCARQLVAQRRLRMKDEVRWERFSTLTDYVCCLRPCEKKHRAFTNLRDFEEHLRNDHNVTKEGDIREHKKNWSRCWKYQKPDK